MPDNKNDCGSSNIDRFYEQFPPFGNNPLVKKVEVPDVDYEYFEKQSDNPCDYRKSVEIRRQKKYLHNTNTALLVTQMLDPSAANPRAVYTPIGNTAGVGNIFLQSIGASVTIPNGYEGTKINYKAILNDAEWSEYFEVRLFINNSLLNETEYEVIGYKQNWISLCVSLKQNTVVRVCGRLIEASYPIIRQRISFMGFLELEVYKQEI